MHLYARASRGHVHSTLSPTPCRTPHTTHQQPVLQGDRAAAGGQHHARRPAGVRAKPATGNGEGGEECFAFAVVCGSSRAFAGTRPSRGVRWGGTAAVLSSPRAPVLGVRRRLVDRHALPAGLRTAMKRVLQMIEGWLI